MEKFLKGIVGFDNSCGEIKDLFIELRQDEGKKCFIVDRCNKTGGKYYSFKTKAKKSMKSLYRKQTIYKFNKRWFIQWEMKIV